MTDPTILQPLPECFNLAQHLLACNSQRAGKTAFIDDVGALTFGQLEQRVRRMAAALREAGIKREERVLLLMHDCNDWPVSFLGAMYAGVVPVAVNTLLTADDYAYMLENSRAQAALVSGALLPALRAAMTRSEHEVSKVIVSCPVAPLQPGEGQFEDFLRSAAPAGKPAATGPDDPGFWLYSSGSTGRPKGTVHSHANPFGTVELYGKGVLALTEKDICFSAAKLFFAYGLGNALTFPMSVGATTLLMAERPTPEATFKRLTEQKPTVFFGAPTGFAGMLASAQLPARDQVALRLVSSAGEALPADLGERFTRHFGVDIVDGIGSTEMLHIFLSNHPDDVRYGTTGKAVPGYELRIVTEDGADTEDGETGELIVKGPSAAEGYWNQRDKSRRTFRGEWTYTRDTYIRDADGYYRYCGRSDDMLKVSGIWVSPFEVEEALIGHAAVLEAAVVGHPDPEGLIKPKAFVVLQQSAQRDDDDALCEALQNHVKEQIGVWKYPRWIEFCEGLPKTATGKIQRYKLRQ